MKCDDHFWLRSAGFPVDAILQKDSLSNFPSFSDYSTARLRRDHLRNFFLQYISEKKGEDQCRKFSRKLQANQPLSTRDLPERLRGPLADPISDWQEITSQIGMLEETARLEFYDFSELAGQKLIDFLAQPEVSEAIFISNPTAAQRIQSLVTERYCVNDSRKKQKIRLGWNYAQRFCTKNDTCSFFGPIAWGHFDDDQYDLASIVWTPGQRISQRETFFESWVAQRLVEKINADCPKPERLPLVLNPGCHLHGEVLYYPLDKSRHLSGTILEVVRAIASSDTPCSAEWIAHGMGSKCIPLIDHLIKTGIVQRGFQISPRDTEAFDTQLNALRKAGMPAEFIEKWFNIFKNLESQRKTYAEGDLSLRQQALEAMNHSLTEAGVSLSRESGKMYVGRYPVYEDCACESIVSFSRALQKQLESDLAPLMKIYQWLSRTCAALLHQAWLDIYQEMLAEKDIKSLSLLGFLQVLKSQQPDIEQRVIKAVRSILSYAWNPLLTAQKGEELNLGVLQIGQVLNTLYNFCPESRGFQVFGDSFHSPDFMISANNLDALNRGEYWLVVGETHPSVCTLCQPVAEPFCPYTKEIEKLVNALFYRKRVFLADSPESYQRSHIDWPLITRYSQLILPSGGGCVDPSRRYPIGRAKLQLKGKRLYVSDTEGAFQEDLLCVCSTSLHQILFKLAGDVLPRQDPRRLRVNRTVYKRRTWEFMSDTWPTLKGEDFEIFMQWHCWQKRHGLPRWVFIKCDSEPKPLFVDFQNPLSFNTMTTALKKATIIMVSEMLPGPDGLWLNDARGRVCCEIRTTFSTSE